MELIKSQNISAKQVKKFDLKSAIKDAKKTENPEKKNYESPYKIKNVIPQKVIKDENSIYAFLNNGRNSPSP